VAATPRSDADAEWVALQLDADQVVARQPTYDRVSADLAAIRQAMPDLADIGVYPFDDGTTVILAPTEQTFRSIEADDYRDWDCLNDFYGLQSVIPEPDPLGTPQVLVTLKGRYNMPLVAELYARLPGITNASDNPSVGDGSKICAARDGASYSYVLDRAGGDCPAGCTTHQAYYFVSNGPGQVELRDTWDDSAGKQPAPAWWLPSCSR
jgi:hypothetical protein